MRRPSYAEIVSASKNPKPLFEDIPLPPRQIQHRDGKPLILFSNEEFCPTYQSMSNAVVLKFTETRPRVEAVKDFIKQHWYLESMPGVGALDGRHILLICLSAADAAEVLTNDSHRIGNLSFRTLRWTAGFSVKAEPTTMVTWAKLTGLDPCLYRTSFLREICRGFGRFLKADPRTLDLSNPGMARPLAKGIWVGTELQQQWVEIEYEGKLVYCYRCKKQGHSIGSCGKEIARSRRAAEKINRQGEKLGPTDTRNGLPVSQDHNELNTTASNNEGKWLVPKGRKKTRDERKHTNTWKQKCANVVEHGVLSKPTPPTQDDNPKAAERMRWQMRTPMKQSTGKLCMLTCTPLWKITTQLLSKSRNPTIT
uniref:DUF4283 domain-containing protein n=1 Tax=Kalanchoe fedtschenkoi TaxID=63787 RepID=A0A7N0ZU89_KALFE